MNAKFKLGFFNNMPPENHRFSPFYLAFLLFQFDKGCVTILINTIKTSDISDNIQILYIIEQ